MYHIRQNKDLTWEIVFDGPPELVMLRNIASEQSALYFSAQFWAAFVQASMAGKTPNVMQLLEHLTKEIRPHELDQAREG